MTRNRSTSDSANASPSRAQTVSSDTVATTGSRTSGGQSKTAESRLPPAEKIERHRVGLLSGNSLDCNRAAEFFLHFPETFDFQCSAALASMCSSGDSVTQYLGIQLVELKQKLRNREVEVEAKLIGNLRESGLQGRAKKSLASIESNRNKLAEILLEQNTQHQKRTLESELAKLDTVSEQAAAIENAYVEIGSHLESVFEQWIRSLQGMQFTWDQPQEITAVNRAALIAGRQLLLEGHAVRLYPFCRETRRHLKIQAKTVGTPPQRQLWSKTYFPPLTTELL